MGVWQTTLRLWITSTTQNNTTHQHTYGHDTNLHSLRREAGKQNEKLFSIKVLSAFIMQYAHWQCIEGLFQETHEIKGFPCYVNWRRLFKYLYLVILSKKVNWKAVRTILSLWFDFRKNMWMAGWVRSHFHTKSESLALISQRLREFSK